MKKGVCFYSLTVALSIIAAATHVRAALITFSFNGASGNETSFGPDAKPNHLTVSAMTRGSGVTAQANSETFSARSWTTGSSIDPNDYFTFSITPETGYSMTLSSLVLDDQRSGTGVQAWSVRSSLNGFAANLSTFAVPNTTLMQNQTTLLSGAYSALPSALEFRIYGYSSSGSSGTWKIDNLRVEGSASAITSRVPETLPFGFSGLALLGTVIAGRTKIRSAS